MKKMVIFFVIAGILLVPCLVLAQITGVPSMPVGSPSVPGSERSNGVFIYLLGVVMLVGGLLLSAFCYPILEDDPIWPRILGPISLVLMGFGAWLMIKIITTS